MNNISMLSALRAANANDLTSDDLIAIAAIFTAKHQAMGVDDTPENRAAFRDALKSLPRAEREAEYRASGYNLAEKRWGFSKQS